MIFEIFSTAVIGAVGGYAFCKNAGLSLSNNDAEKIRRIFENSKLLVMEEGRKKTIRLHRKRKIDGGTEYVYQMPLGMSFKEVESNKNVIEDGLNIQSGGLSMNLIDFKTLMPKKGIIKQIKKLLNKHQKAHKEIILEFDGMLKIRVYNESLTALVKWSEGLLKNGWSVPVGISRDGAIYHDFESQPHLIVAGSTGFGKSVFLKMMITSLVTINPNDVKFSLIDLKEGAAFNRFRNLKQVAHFATDPDSALKILRSIQMEMVETLKDYTEKGFEDAKEAGIKTRHFVVIDEAADLDKNALEIVKDIARRGRGPGYRLIYATQYPTTETVPSQVKRNIPARLCFILDSATASNTVLGINGAESLPEIKGRGIYKTIKPVIVQTPFMSNKAIKEQIAPHINISPRKDDRNEHRANPKRGGDPFELSETGLS